MKFRLLPAGLFASLALNLFLVGVVAGGWRDLLGQAGPGAVTPPPAAVEASAPPEENPGLTAEIPGPPANSVPPAAGRPIPRTDAPVRAVRNAPIPPPPADALPPTGDAPRGPWGNPLMRAAHDLPPPQRLALIALLRSESEAVRSDLQQARRERAMAWRALARGDIGEEEAARRLDIARRRELAARGRVEGAVADWAVRQSPEIRLRVGQALAEDVQPGRRRPVRRPGEGPEGRPGWPPPPGAPGPEGES